jgi:Fe-S-cluster containining protein
MAKLPIHPIFKKNITTSSSEIDEIAKRVDRDVFQDIDCLACGNCCKSAPPLITKEDINRISKELSISSKKFIRKYVLEDYNGEMSFMSIPCVFLEDDNRCKIYKVRPAACRDYPHISSGRFLARAKMHTQNEKICPGVEKILEIMEKKITASPS